MICRRILCSTSLVSAFLLVTLLQACGSSEDEGHVLGAGGWNLLGRGADVLQDQPGLITAGSSGSKDEPWGRLGPMGWEKKISKENGRSAVHATGSSAFLILPASVVRSREIALEAWVSADEASEGVGPGPNAEIEADLLLNGIHLGTISLTDRPRELRLEAPREAWRAGDNLLGIALVDSLSVGATHLSLSRVRYDTPRAISQERAKGRATLETETALGFLFEPLAAGHLVLRAQALGPGRLTVALHRVERDTGELGRQLQRLELDLEAPSGSQSIERGLALPEETGQLLRVLVGWQAADEADLVLDGLTLVEQRDVPRPPVILISIDTLAAANSSLFGYERKTTPALEALAADGIVFERCLSNATWTLPSFLSLMTGLYPGAHRGDPSRLGPERRVELWEQWYLTDNRWTLAEALRSRGYRTAGWVDSVWLRDRFNFPQGFEAFDPGASLIPKPDPDGGMRYVTDGALDWLKTILPGEPYFLFLHAFDVHGPYSPDRKRRGMFRDQLDESVLAPAGGVHNAFGAIPGYITEVEWSGETPEQVPIARVRAAYDEGLRMTDAMLGEFLDELRASGRYDEALIIVTSDHGETMGEGAYRFGHGIMDEAVLHIPLVVKLPGNKRAGTRVQDTLSLVDLYPSVLSFAGGEPRTSDWGLHGVNRFGEKESEQAPAVIFSEAGLCRQFSLEQGPWRLVELWPALESTPEFVLTHPLALALLDPTRDPQRMERGTPAALLAELRADSGLVDWIETSNAEGLTPARLDLLRQDEHFTERIQLLRRCLRGPFHMLGKTREGRAPSLELAAEYPQEVARLRDLLKASLLSRDKARSNGHAPTQPVEFSPDQLEELSKIGYAEK